MLLVITVALVTLAALNAILTAWATVLDASLPPNHGAELQLAIYPWEYWDGPILDVSGSPGGFAARDLEKTAFRRCRGHPGGPVGRG